MFEDYKMAILNFYRDQRSKGLLSTEMESPNRERLRKECIAVFLKKESKADKDLVQKIFDPKRNYESQLRSIEKYRLDGFRPLVTFLTQKEDERRNIRDDNQVKLLAWLLDFPNYEDWRKSILREDFVITEDIEEDTDEVEEDEETLNENGQIEIVGKVDLPTKEEEKNRNKFSLIKKWSLGVTATFILTGFVYFPRYMTWKGDRYEWLFFASKDASVIAIDWDMIRNFRKVTRKDTLTEYSVGKLWYLKDDNDHDVFTMGGKHPIFNHRSLHLLSPRILDSIRSRIELEKLTKQNQSLVSK